MFEKICTLVFIRKGWVYDTYSNCHIYLDGTRVLLKYDDYIETYICSQYDIHFNHIFMGHIISIIKNRSNNVTLKQLISYYSSKCDRHTQDLHNFIVNMLPGTQIVNSYTTDSNFSYQKQHELLICKSDYFEHFQIFEL